MFFRKLLELMNSEMYTLLELTAEWARETVTLVNFGYTVLVR